MTGSGWAQPKRIWGAGLASDRGGRAAEIMGFEHFLEGLKGRWWPDLGWQAIPDQGCSSVKCKRVKFNFSGWLFEEIRTNMCYWFWYYTMHITLYITLRHFKRQLHLQWPMVHQQIHSSSPNASLKRWVLKNNFKVSVFVSSWRLDGRESFGPENEKLRSPKFPSVRS